jgi:hypothetical protein
MTAMVLTQSRPGAAQVVVGGGYPYPYPPYRYAVRDSAVRFDVKPTQTAVYLDGYYAGVVDDYDGVFQRMYTVPGGHEITLYLEGYRTYTERVYLSPDNTFKFHHRMEKLLPGESAERPPAPQPPPQIEGQGPQGQGVPPPGRVGRRGLPPNYPRVPPGPPQPQGAAPVEGEHGTLSLSVRPNDAEVLVDGAPWREASQDRLLIELPEGRHNIQIRKAGFVGYLTDVQIRRGETTNLDVQLKTQPQ